MRRLAVSNEKGGTGKTTTATNLAHGLALAGRRVLLVDLDSQGNARRALGMSGTGRTIADVLLGACSWRDAVTTARLGLDFIPSGPDLADAKDELIAKAAADGVIATMRGRHVDADATQFVGRALRDDYLVFDCAPSRDVLNANVTRFVGEVLIPVSVDYLASVGAGQHTASILEAQRGGADVRIAYVLPTFFDGRRLLSREILAELQKVFGRAVAEPIPVNVALAEAPSFGKTIFEYAPKSTGADAYSKPVERVLRNGKEAAG
jgi:chromosome partitioning protein